MAEERPLENSEGSETQPNPAPKSVDLNVGGNVEGNVVVGDHNYIVNNYYPAVESNTEKHEPDFWALKHPYPMPPNFTGRIAERALLTHWLKEDSENRLFILRALGGFGKSALAWQWLTHDVGIKEFPKVLWWSFYEGDASFEHFIEETLKYLKLDIPQGQRPQVDELLKAMQSQKILLIMDGFERALRAYSSMNAAYQGDEEPKLEDNQLDCVNLNAEIFLKSVCSLPNIKSKVLVTTRLTPRAVKPRGEFILGCREEKLEAMQKADAVEFFRKQGIKGTHVEIEAACAPYGYHPLSLRLLAGRILKDFENPSDIVVAQKLKIDGDIIQQKHHVLEVSYNSLPPHEQKLLSTIACFRSPVELKTLEAITENKNTLNDDLHDLVVRGLLHFDEKNKKFDLHPIVRRFAYNRLTVPQRTDTHVVLVVYFEAVPSPQKVEKVEDLAPVIELYHHTVQAGELDKAFELFHERLSEAMYFQMGAYQTIGELLRVLFLNGEENPPRLKNQAAQAWTINMLANVYSQCGQPTRAVPLFMASNLLDEKRDNKRGIAIGLGNAASQQFITGSLQLAEANLRRRIELTQEIPDEHSQGIGHRDIGRLLSYRGLWEESKSELNDAIEIFQKENFPHGQSVSLAYLVQREILMQREGISDSSPLEFAKKALEFTEEWAQTNYPIEREYVRDYWVVGVVHYSLGDLQSAERYLVEALMRDRAINMVDHEANILLDLARLRYDQKNYEEARFLTDEALIITERCGYVLQGADVNLFLAQYALEQEKDNAKAKEYAETALKLAHCDGPPYYYKVAYDEAVAMLERLKV